MLEDKVILIVDDDLTLLEMYVERIKAEGAIVIQAHDGEEALAQVKDGHPHLVLLDIMMPKVNGIQVLSELKSDPETSNTPVIVLSALGDDNKKRECLKLGASGYIVKSDSLPIDVIEKIKQTLSSEM